MIKHKIQIGRNILDPSLRYALSGETRERNFFTAFRSGLKIHIEELLKEAGVGARHITPPPKYFHPKKSIVSVAPITLQNQTLDAEFCLGYGFTESSIAALNYLYQGPSQNSLLPFLESDSFSIGNFLFRLEPGDYELAVDFVDGVTAAGYATDVRSCSLGSCLAILGLRFASEAIKKIAVPLPELEYLDELSPCSAPPLWVNRKTGKVFTCTCFSYMAKRLWSRQPSQSEPFKIGDYAEVRLRPGLCSICSDHVPPPKVGNAMFYNTFLRRYLPYRELFFMKMFDGLELEAACLSEGERVAEDAARLAVGYPMIGQKWISETTLYRTVRSLLAPRIVFQHYQGKELDGQEIDVWIPSLKLAIEYQGPQHSLPFTVWGGEAALAVAKERDERKRRKLNELGYHLVEFNRDEQLTEETVLERIRPYLPDAPTPGDKSTIKNEIVDGRLDVSLDARLRSRSKENQAMNSLNEERLATCRQIYENMQAGYSLNCASRMIGKSPSWASRWLPIYLRQGANLELEGLAGKSPFEREAERLRRIAEDCEKAAGKIAHLFSFNWDCPELSQLLMIRAELSSSLQAIARKLRDKRKIVLKEGKAHRK